MSTLRPAVARVAGCAMLLCAWSAAQTAGAGDEVRSYQDQIEAARPLIRAVNQFYCDCGLWPQRLEDLAPRYAAEVLHDGQYVWSFDSHVLAKWAAPTIRPTRGEQRVELVYVFNLDDVGWYVGAPGAVTSLDLSEPLPAPPPRGKRIAAAIAEFDRRIAREPDNVLHHQGKTIYLYRTNRLEDARRAAVAWIQRYPREFEPRVALMDIERRSRAGIDRLYRVRAVDYDARRKLEEKWSQREHSSYGIWCLFNDPLGNSDHQRRLADAVHLPFCASREEWYIAEACVVDHAAFLLHRREYDRCLELCTRWQQAAEQQQGLPCDQSYLAFRAGVYLARGEFDQARKYASQAAEAEKNGLLWAGNTTPLLDAITARNHSFDYAPADNARTHNHWWLDPNVDLPSP